MGIIERIAWINATLYQATSAIEDGEIVWDNGTAYKVFLLESKQNGFDEYGKVQFSKVFLATPETPEPALPARLAVGGETYDIASIKPYRNMRGKLLGYRLATPANGGA